MSKELSGIHARLMTLEAMMREKWNAHDKRSDENWNEVKEVLGNLKDFMVATPGRRADCMKEARIYAATYTSKQITLWLGIPVSITVIIVTIVEIHNFLACIIK